MRLLQIDELTRSDHYYLEPSDVCYYLGDYASRQGYNYSDTNQLILNFKIRPSEIACSPNRKWHKVNAIKRVADFFQRGLTTNGRKAVFVPMPPSKTQDNVDYDDRVVDLCTQICSKPSEHWRCCELLRMKHSIEAFHEKSNRRMEPSKFEQYLQFVAPDDKLNISTIFLVDDVLTTGSHFKAAQSVLHKHLGDDVKVIGLFIARTIHPVINDFEDISD